MSSAVSKVEQVKLRFGQAESYVDRWGYNIRIRAETVKDFVGSEKFHRILDVGCGDGSISLPLLTKENQLTLLDLSSGMLSSARAKIPAALSENVRLINQDIVRAELEPYGYDLILCLGVLAHVDSPAAVVGRLAGLLSPGGTILLEATDCQHFWSYMLKAYDRILDQVKPTDYTLNAHSVRDVLGMFAQHGLRPVSSFRYSYSPPGMQRLFSQDSIYALIRLIYGRYPRMRNAWLGNECIFHLKVT